MSADERVNLDTVVAEIDAIERSLGISGALVMWVAGAWMTMRTRYA